MINNKKVKDKVFNLLLHSMLIDWLLQIGLDNAYKIFRTPTAFLKVVTYLESYIKLATIKFDHRLKSKKTNSTSPHAFGNRKVDDYKEKEPKNIEESHNQ
ncbi:hypothetical protein HYD57_00910 [Mycoplasmopsis bovis]|nr:hypothetical protein [Mycoplasmopsis bovis]QQH66273.1 hypothetical protein HYD57_00910 [Mycoplasmopsis bovis]